MPRGMAQEFLRKYTKGISVLLSYGISCTAQTWGRRRAYDSFNCLMMGK